MERKKMGTKWRIGIEVTDRARFQVRFFFPISIFPFPAPRSPFPIPRSLVPVPRSSFPVLVTSLPECLQLQACRLHSLSMTRRGNCYLVTLCKTPMLINTAVFHECGKNRPLQLLCFISPVKVSGEFEPPRPPPPFPPPPAPQSFHMPVKQAKEVCCRIILIVLRFVIG